VSYSRTVITRGKPPQSSTMRQCAPCCYDCASRASPDTNRGLQCLGNAALADRGDVPVRPRPRCRHARPWSDAAESTQLLVVDPDPLPFQQQLQASPAKPSTLRCQFLQPLPCHSLIRGPMAITIGDAPTAFRLLKLASGPRRIRRGAGAAGAGGDGARVIAGDHVARWQERRRQRSSLR